jgi:hypothetical protein
MAGAYEDLTNARKTLYAPGIVEALVNNQRPFTSWLNKGAIPNSQVHRKGGRLTFYQILAPPQNIGVSADTDAYPAPKERTDLLLTVDPKLMVGAMEIGEITRNAVNSGASGWNGGELMMRTNEAMKNTAKHIERLYAGTAGTGRLAVVASDGSNAFVVYAAPPNNEGTLLIKQNMYISVRTTNGGDTVRDSCDYRLVTDVAKATNTITYNGADQTLVDGDHVHLVVKATQTSLSSIHPNGIRGLIDDGTYLTTVQGQSRSSYPQLKAQVSSNGGTTRALSEAILDELIQKIYHAQDSGAPTDFWSNTGQGRMYNKFVTPDRRFNTTGAPIKYTVGWQERNLVYESNWGQIEFHVAPDFVPRELYMINRRHLWRYEAKPLGVWEAGGSNGLMPSVGSSAYKPAWFQAVTAIENIACNNFPAQGVVRDLLDPIHDGAL